MAHTVSTVVTISVADQIGGCEILMVDNDGTIYISYLDSTIKQVSPTTGAMTHYAGLPKTGYGSAANHQDGTLATARFHHPRRMVKGPDGTLYVGEDSYIRAIRGQNVTTLAGRGEDSEAIIPGEIRGWKGHDHIIDGPGPAAHISIAEDIWFDSDGRLLFWDEGDTLRTVAPDGTVTTIAYRDAEMDDMFDNIHTPGQVEDVNGNAYFPNNFDQLGDEVAIIRRLPDGSKQAFGRKVAKGGTAQNGPLSTATFNDVGSVGYDKGRECLYTMEREKTLELDLLRKIDLSSPVKNQLMGEQISRQTALIPDVMKNIMEFSNAKDPRRIVLDQYKKQGVALPRGGRRTRRRKVNRKKKMTRKRRSTSS